MTAFDIPLDLAHASKISMRIEYHLQNLLPDSGDPQLQTLRLASRLIDLLLP